jgi:hypothetical protein
LAEHWMHIDLTPSITDWELNQMYDMQRHDKCNDWDAGVSYGVVRKLLLA